MEFLKLTSAIVFIGISVSGCGAGDSALPEENMGAIYTGKISDSEITDANVAQLSEDAAAVVKAITFYHYEERPEDYEKSKYLASIRLAGYLKSMIDLKLPDLKALFGTGDIAKISVEGACGGLAEISGSVQNLTIKASQLCEEYNENISLELSGEYVYQESGYNYNIAFSQADILLNYSERLAVLDERVTGEGHIDYAVNSTFSQLNVSSNVIVNELQADSDVTLTCIIDSNNCHFKADVLADNGVTYRVDDLHANLSSSGYDGYSDLYVPDFGRMLLDYSAITYCEDGSIASGSIVLLLVNQGASIGLNYSDCGVYDAYYDAGDLQK